MKTAVYAITETGCLLANQIATALDGADVLLPKRFSSLEYNSKSPIFYERGGFADSVKDNWKNYQSHIFIMATGIVVRNIAPLLEHKSIDPAVVVCDEKGRYSISLLSGHIGGANRLAVKVSEIVKGDAVITTATDVQGLMAFDEMASIEGWSVINPKAIRFLNSLLLEAKPIGVVIPKTIWNKYYLKRENVILLSDIKQAEKYKLEGIVFLNPDLGANEFDIPLLKMSSKI